eukprot:69387-Prymnesium_polylepis.1
MPIVALASAQRANSSKSMNTHHSDRRRGSVSGALSRTARRCHFGEGTKGDDNAPDVPPAEDAPENF